MTDNLFDYSLDRTMQNFDLPEKLYDEIRVSISGRIIRQTDPEYIRIKYP